MGSPLRRRKIRSGSTVPFVTTKDHNPLATFVCTAKTGSRSNCNPFLSQLTPLVYTREVLYGLANTETVLLHAVKRIRAQADEKLKMVERTKLSSSAGASSELPFFSETKMGPLSPTMGQRTIATTVLEHHKNSENEKRAAKDAADKLEAHFRGLKMSSRIHTLDIKQAIGMTVIPERNFLAIVHDESKISIMAVVKDWRLQRIATFSVHELDRRQKPQLLAMNGVIAAVPNQIFVLNRNATRIMRFDFDLYEAARSTNALELRDVTSEVMGKSLVGTFLGLTAILKYNELYTSTGDHIVVYSIGGSGREMLRSAVVQPPSSIVSNWHRSGVCYGIPHNDKAAMRIKFFRDNKKHDGYDIKIINTKGIFENAGAAYDMRSNSLLVVSNDSIVGVASVNINTTCCCIQLPTVVAFPNLSLCGITKPIGLATLEPRLHCSAGLKKRALYDSKVIIEEKEPNATPATTRRAAKSAAPTVMSERAAASQQLPPSSDGSRSLLVVLDGATSSLCVFS